MELCGSKRGVEAILARGQRISAIITKRDPSIIHKGEAYQHPTLLHPGNIIPSQFTVGVMILLYQSNQSKSIQSPVFWNWIL